MQKIKQKRRLLAVLLTVVLVIGSLPLTGFAAGSVMEKNRGGGTTNLELCEHHKKHTDECGYESGNCCAHNHTDDCRTDAVICGYIVDEDELASPSERSHWHSDDCYEMDCPHKRSEHDENCGYEEGYPCEYECLLCANLDSGLEADMDSDGDNSLATDSDIPLIAATLSNWQMRAGMIEGNGYVFSPEDGVLTVSTDAGAKAWYEENKITLSDVKSLIFEDGVTTLPALMSTSMNLTALTSVSIPGSVKTVENFAFAWSKTLTTVTLGEGLTTIGNSMFHGCSSLDSIVLPKTVTKIGMMAFYECSSLTSIVIPPKVTSIENNAFSGCKNLSEITFMGGGDNYLSIGASAFKNVAVKGTIYHPKGWSSPGNLPASYNWPRVASLELISGDGYQFDPVTGKLTVTEIEGASMWRSDGMIPNRNFLSVEVLGNATHVKNSVFNNKGFLKSVVIGEQVESMGSRVFESSSKIEEIRFKGNIPELDLTSGTFYGIGNSGTVYCPSWAPGYDEEWLKSVGLTSWTLAMEGGPVDVPLELYDRVNFGGYDWWVIGLNEVGVYSRPGNMTLLLANGLNDSVKFGVDGKYGGSSLENAMTEFYDAFPENGKSRILPRPALDSVYTGGGAGNVLTGRCYIWPLSNAEIKGLPKDCLAYEGDWWLRSASSPDTADAVNAQGQETGGEEVGSSLQARPAMVMNLDSTVFLTVSAGEGGCISPSGTVIVEENGDQTFTIRSEEGYEIEQVLVDGVNVGAVSSYTLSEINAETSIMATFKPKTYSIAAIPADLNFGSYTVGYAAPDAQTVLIHNTGNQSVTLEKPVISNQSHVEVYEVGALSETTLVKGGEAAFTIRPVTGLPTGLYVEKVTITGSGNAGVEVNLTFTVTEKPVYAVTVDSDGGGAASASSARAEAGEIITLSYIPDKGYRFKEWLVVSGGVTINHHSFTMPAESVVIRAVFEKQEEKPDNPRPSGSSDSGNENIPQERYVISGDSMNLSVPIADLQRLADRGKNLTIQGHEFGMTFETAAIRAILASASSTGDGSGTGESVNMVIFSAEPASLSRYPDAENLIENRPLYDFTISFQNKAGKITDSKVDFPANSTIISLNYTPKEGEVPENLFIVYIDENGNVIWINKSCYSNGGVYTGEFGGQMKAEVSHFSRYGVAYKAAVPVLGDIAEHWAKKDIMFAVAHGLISEKETRRFFPDAAVTRKEVGAALVRLTGTESAGYISQSFTDGQADTPVTREEMAVVLANYAVQTGASIPLPYAMPVSEDQDAVSPDASKEVAAMQHMGIMANRDNNCFEPKAFATRAEAAAALYRFVAITLKANVK